MGLCATRRRYTAGASASGDVIRVGSAEPAHARRVAVSARDGQNTGDENKVRGRRGCGRPPPSPLLRLGREEGRPPPHAYARSPRRQRARWMSFGWTVTRPLWMHARLVSASSDTTYDSVASCAARIALLWKRRPSFCAPDTSRTRRWKGA
ncbi:uncharacterized protein Tco025E_09284, partial [Trypanosoma conorhini]